MYLVTDGRQDAVRCYLHMHAICLQLVQLVSVRQCFAFSGAGLANDDTEYMKTITLDAEHTAAEFMACVQFARCNSCLLHIVCQFLISLFIALHERLWPKSALCTVAQPNSAGSIYKICSLDMQALALTKFACLDP